MHTSSHLRHLRRLPLALLLCASGAAMAATFSVAGSAGTVDNDDEATYYTSGSSVGVLNSAPDAATVNVFYNVPQISGFSGARTLRWMVRYREDTGSRLVLTLRRFDLETGVTTTVDTFDSDDYADTIGAPRTDAQCGAPVTWDYNNATYSVDAAITRPNDANLAILYGFSLESLVSCP